MVAFLEKTDGNAEFHEIIDFLTRSSIYYALTVSPIVSTTFVEQFWMTAKSKTINYVRYITATVAGKPVSISEASIRRNVTPLFNSMLVQPTEDEGEVSERPSESQPIPSPTHPSEDQPESQPDPSPRPSSSIPIPNSNPEGSGGNHGAQAAEIKDLKAQIKQLKKKTRPGRKAVKSSKGAPSVQTHTDWDGLDTDLEASLNDAMDYTQDGDTLVVEDKGSKGTDLRQSIVMPDKGTNKQDASTVKSDEGTDKQNGGIDRTKVSTDSFVEGTAEIKDQVSGESDTPIVPTMTSTPTPTVFVMMRLLHKFFSQ
ncbi:hypothetical protein Tco_0435027 [Tanacetum coccineum]